ncbi:MAG: CBS and ACT domain-containing protein [Deltaproteobacteria bacterium]|nr:CBS and ACT domain-containing protein [Deltaproteobacteria bacterium]
MPVQDYMSKDLITIDEDASIMRASKLMKQNNIRHLPVLRKGRLVGIVTDRELKEAAPSKATLLDIHEMYHLLDQVAVKGLMPKKLYTIGPEATVEKAAAIMLSRNISALPVVDEKGGLIGIIAKGDIFRAFVSISGINQAPLAMGFVLKDEPGSIKKVTDIIRAHGGRLGSILTGYEGVQQGFRKVFIRVLEVKDESALRKELEAKQKILYFIHERVDHVEALAAPRS